MTQRASGLSVITDWRVRDEDLPDVPPGGEYTRVIASQRFFVLHRIVTRGLNLRRLQIGALDVPFELEGSDGEIRRYRPEGLDDDAVKQALVLTGAAVVDSNTIAIAPGLEIWLYLRNESSPTKPRVALLVQEKAL